MESEISETNLVIVTRKYRILLFCKIYWRTLLFILTPLFLLPIAFIGNDYEYLYFYVFLVTTVYWIADVLHPAIISMIPIACYSIFGVINGDFISLINVNNDIFDCLGVMMLIAAMEHSRVHQRAALKILITVGCSHYKLSFLFFFSTMFLSMWISNTIACGLMMPLVKAVLVELEKMGIMEMYQTIGKTQQKSHRHEMSNLRPTNYTLLYFLGIAYSTSIGGMASLYGSPSNRLFRTYCESMFPVGPKIEFPQFMLVNLPGVLVMETLLYVWLNSYFLGMFRFHQDIGLQIGMTEEEARYIKTLLKNEYASMGKFKFHEGVVSATVILAVILEFLNSAVDTVSWNSNGLENMHHKISSPTILCVIVLIAMPTNLNFMKFFRRRRDSNEPLPTSNSKSCLNWAIIRENMLWSTLFVIGESSMTPQALKHFGATMRRVLRCCEEWPASVLVLFVLATSKILTERIASCGLLRTSFPELATLSHNTYINPHYLVLAATLGSSMPFHLVTGCPSNAMVAEYVRIPPWKMLSAGIGPSIIAVVISWFTVIVWSKVIWIDYPLQNKP